MPTGWFLLELLSEYPAVQRPWCKPRTLWGNYISVIGLEMYMWFRAKSGPYEHLPDLQDIYVQGFREKTRLTIKDFIHPQLVLDNLFLENLYKALQEELLLTSSQAYFFLYTSSCTYEDLVILAYYSFHINQQIPHTLQVELIYDATYT